MSLLAPLYVLGALAVALPVIFHLIRRQVKRRTPISTMMFLPTTEPKLSRQSRLENWPLLALRALALALLALAFSRPFLRSESTTQSDVTTRRVVVMVDTSASMRRGDLWSQAIGELREVTRAIEPGDSLAILSFDSSPRMRLDFDASAALGLASLRSIGDTLFADEEPSWEATDLGAALRFVADLVAGDGSDGDAAVDLSITGAPSEDGSPGEAIRNVDTQVVLISDMQSGARLDVSQGLAWPRRTPLEVRRVVPSDKTNAWVTLATSQDDAIGGAAGAEGGVLAGGDSKPDQRFRLRVSNSPDSIESRFRLRWVTAAPPGANGMPENEDSQWSVEIPPGRSRVVRVSRPPVGSTAIELLGDDHDFDNRRYHAAQPPRRQTLMFVGSDAAEPRDSLFYYLQRLPLDTRDRTVAVTRVADIPGQSPEPQDVPLVVVTGEIGDQAAAMWKGYVASGGRLVYVLPPAMGNNVAQDSLRRLTGWQDWSVGEAMVRDYAMWSRIDFAHPLFAPLADPKFNDFSKIRFWAHRTVTGVGKDWRTIARFDDDSPAILEWAQPSGPDGKSPAGRIWVFATGWQPVESQLALSTKFIPLVFGMLEAGRSGDGAGGGDRFLVGDPVASAVGAGAAGGVSGDTVVKAYRIADDVPGSVAGEAVAGDSFARPGIYRVARAAGERTVAVNLADSESETDPLGDEELERLGVSLGRSVSSDLVAQAQRQLRDGELEGQQGLWRWLLVGVMGLLAAETLVGGWIGRGRRSSAGRTGLSENAAKPGDVNAV